MNQKSVTRDEEPDGEKEIIVDNLCEKTHYRDVGRVSPKISKASGIFCRKRRM